jgi:hypothetical protein
LYACSLWREEAPFGVKKFTFLWFALQSIMAGLKQSDDDSAQLIALTDLCEHLSISTEESLATFPVEQVVPLLVRKLKGKRYSYHTLYVE